MKLLVFSGDKEDYASIVSDNVIKRHIDVKIYFQGKLLIGLGYSASQENLSYIMLKYGEMLISTPDLVPSRKPIIFQDYVPKNLPKPEVLAVTPYI